MKADLKSLFLPEIEEIVLKGGFQKYRAKQIYDKLRSGAMSIDEINIPKDMKEYLKENYFIPAVVIEEKFESQIDPTIKYLFRLFDGEFIEAVLMEYHHGNTLCISTQVGCRMGCAFCASTIGGLKRNLYPSEMIGQIEVAQRDSGKKISNIVMMGIGEPFDNFENVKSFLNMLSMQGEISIGARHISLSTSGNVDGIKELAKMHSQVTLSVSLHAPNDKIRDTIMPVNKKWNISELISACKEYIKITNRRISFEYAMIDGVNDSRENAEELANLLSGMLCHVNLIPVNKVSERNFSRSSNDSLRQFEQILQKRKINVTVRRTLGADINASCGQLRRNRKNKKEGSQ